jgi:hypothetical protein
LAYALKPNIFLTLTFSKLNRGGSPVMPGRVFTKLLRLSDGIAVGRLTIANPSICGKITG